MGFNSAFKGLIITKITGATCRAILSNRVTNLNYSEFQDRVMLTGRHMVRHVSCEKIVMQNLVRYEFVTEENQRYR